MLFGALLIAVSFLAPTSLSITTASGCIQSAQNTASIGSGTFDVTLGSTPTSGNTLFLTYAGFGETTNPTISSVSETGVTWAEAVSKDGSVDVEIWYGTVGANAGNTATIAVTGGSTSAIGNIADICEWGNIATTNPVDKTAVNAGQSDTGDTGTTAVTSQSNELFVGAIGTALGLTDQSSPTNGYCLSNGQVKTLGQYVSLAELVKISTTTETANSGTSFGPAYWAGCIATFKSEDTSPTPTPVETPTPTPVETPTPTPVETPTPTPVETPTPTPVETPTPTPVETATPTRLYTVAESALILLALLLVPASLLLTLHRRRKRDKNSQFKVN
jgi:cell division septation protein DedD